ncbi:MAG: DMT family transporter [Chloroflexi bacterium]|nr:DMT family transporter [Chloroflexota bacterium]
MAARVAPRDAPAAEPLFARYSPELAQLFVIAMWASTYIVTKAAYAELRPLAFAFVRYVAMIGLAFLVLAIRNWRVGPARAAWTVRRADLPRFALAGGCAYTLYQLGFLLGLERTSPFSTSLMIALVPLFTLLILALRGERPPVRAWVALAVAIAGVALFLLDKVGTPGTALGDALALGAGLSFAYYGIVNRPLVAAYPPETYTAYSLLIGALPLIVLSIPDAVAQDWGAISLATWAAIAYMVALPVYLAYILWNWAIARRGVAAASRWTLLVPILSGVGSALVFGESFGPTKIAGALLVFAGLILPLFQAQPSAAAIRR